MHLRERQRAIIGLLNRRPLVTVHELTAWLQASEATVRRDIARLAADGLLRRVHGGAEKAPGKADAAPQTLRGRPLNVNQTRRVAEKRAIGRAAAGLCAEGDSLIVNGGSTTYAVAEFLPARGLHILTNALPLADYLIAHTANRVLMPGGEIFREQNIILSPFETDSMNGFHAARVFIGAQSVGPRGFMETDSILVRAEQQFMQQGEQIIGLVDSAKFHSRGNLILCALSSVNVVITDSGIDSDSLGMLRAADIEVIVVEPDAVRASA